MDNIERLAQNITSFFTTMDNTERLAQNIILGKKALDSVKVIYGDNWIEAVNQTMEGMKEVREKHGRSFNEQIKILSESDDKDHKAIALLGVAAIYASLKGII